MCMRACVCVCVCACVGVAPFQFLDVSRKEDFLATGLVVQSVSVQLCEKH